MISKSRIQWYFYFTQTLIVLLLFGLQYLQIIIIDVL